MAVAASTGEATSPPYSRRHRCSCSGGVPPQLAEQQAQYKPVDTGLLCGRPPGMQCSDSQQQLNSG